MTTRAEATLYWGEIPSNGCWEGWFNNPKDRSYNREHHIAANRVINDYLVTHREPHVWKEGLAKSEKEAKSIIAQVKNSNLKSTDVAQARNCHHGAIFFSRRIIFEGWTEDKRDDLVQRFHEIPNLRQKQITPSASELHSMIINNNLAFYQG